MINEKNTVITYQGNQINLFSDENANYVSLTDIFKAWNRYSKSINAWLKTKQTLEFLNVWEKKNNPKYDETQLSQVMKIARERNGLSAQAWIDATGAIGIFTRSRAGDKPGTYAHKDIAIRFAGWLNPEFELFLVEEIQRLQEIERKKNSFELLSHEQILALVRLKEVFKYVAHQELIEEAHKDIFAAKSGAKNPFAEFNVWRNKILDISAETINDRIMQYCIDNNIALTKKILNKTKRDKIIFLDTYESVRNAVWDFLQVKGEVNALNLANLVEAMIRTEKGELFLKNEDNLFQQKQNLGDFSDFREKINGITVVKKAREVLAIREAEIQKKKISQVSTFDNHLKGLLSVPPPKK
jgi:hypothetical protein